MSTVIYTDNSLQPTELDEPFHATLQNIQAAINNNMFFFLGKNTDGHVTAIRIDKIITMVENDD